MKKIFALVVFYAMANCLKAQDINFNSAYNNIYWPVELSLRGGITGDDGTYKKLTLYHGNSIVFETGTNAVDYSHTRMTIDASGNVGVGTTSPGLTFHVDGLTGFPAITGTTQTGVMRLGAVGGYGSVLDFGSNGASGQGWIQATDKSNLALNYPLSLNPNGGNVGIGTTDPGSYKLAVNGTIHSKAVIIDLVGWPDYVFKKDYKLMPLTQVKSYIDQNQHLPEMPADKEVEAKGLDVGEMNKLLTKKVEELTLYLIEQNKRIEKLEAQIKTNQ